MLEEELVAHPAGRVTRAGLARAEDGELDAGDVQQLGDGLGDLLGPVVDGAGAADPEQVLDVVVDRAVDLPDLEVQLLHPLLADVAAHAPRVPAVLQVAHHHAGLGGEVGLDQHLEAAHVHDVVDVLDVDRALLDAGAAVGAAPQDVGVDDPALLQGADQRAVRLGVVGALDPRVARGPLLLGAGLERGEVGEVGARRTLLAPVRYGALAYRWSRRSMITILGDRGLPVFQAGHWLWHRPHSVQVVKSSIPFQVKSSILPRPKTSSSPGSSKSIGLPPAGHRLQRAQRHRPVVLALEVDVEEGGEPVPGDAHVEHPRDGDQPGQDHDDLDERDDREQVGVAGSAVAERAGERVRPGRRVGQAVGDLERADQQDADADGEDDGLDEVAAALVGPCEPALAALPRGWSAGAGRSGRGCPRTVPVPMMSANRLQRTQSPMIGSRRRVRRPRRTPRPGSGTDRRSRGRRTSGRRRWSTT